MSYSSDTPTPILVIGGIVIVGGIIFTFAKCGAELAGNKDMIDTEWYFNCAIDYKGEGVSIVNIADYTDYEGITVEYVTNGGLTVLTGLNGTEIIGVSSYDEAYQRALELAGNDSSQIVEFDKNMGYQFRTDDSFNKRLINFNYDFDYAIVEDEHGVTITKITNWRDWEDDDKVQFIDTKGIVHLGTYDNVKLVSTIGSSEQELYEYAVSLAGSEDRVFGDINKSNVRSREN